MCTVFKLWNFVFYFFLFRLFVSRPSQLNFTVREYGTKLFSTPFCITVKNILNASCNFSKDVICPANIYLFKTNNKNTRTRHWPRSVFIVNFKHILHLFQMFLLLTLNKWMLVGVGLHYIFGDIVKCRNPLKVKVVIPLKTSQLTCSANQLIGFYMMLTLVLNGLIRLLRGTLKSCPK